MAILACILRLRRKCFMLCAAAVISLLLLYNKSDTQMLDYIEMPTYIKPVCMHPELEMWPSFLQGAVKPKPLTCSQVQANWVTIENGVLRISAEKARDNASCDYTPIKRGDTDFAYNLGTSLKNVGSGFKILNDFFEVNCSMASGEKYKNLHSGIARITTNDIPIAKSKNTHKPLNILMFGFDSTSRMMWRRHLPKTHNYLMNVLRGVLMEGYNIVGDGTPQALLPILTGMNEKELPEARRGYSDAKPVDDHPWIWRRLKQAGYVTQYGEDMAHIGTFHYRMLGFNKQPVDHYMRPFYMHAEKNYPSHQPYCLGSVPRHVNMMKWVRDFFDAYTNRNKFSFLFHSEFSHEDIAKLKLVDDDLVEFLTKLHDKGHLDNTLLILMADHGVRFHAFRSTVQGKQEERMPYMYLRLPPSFIKKHPIAQRNLQVNSKRLSTPYDIHATFLDVLSYDALNTTGDVKNRGISLLKEIPHTRTCTDADIEMHWCACAQWQDVETKDREVMAAAAKMINVINHMTQEHRRVCAELSIEKVKSALRYAPNKEMIMFKRSSDDAGYVPDLTDTMNITEVHYQITMITSPGLAEYEATIKQHVASEQFSLNTHEISRINRYGDQPHCVAAHFPHLRQFCYCKVQNT